MTKSGTYDVAFHAKTIGGKRASFKIQLDIERVSSCLMCVINPSFGPRNEEDVTLSNDENAIELAIKDELYVLGPRVEYIFEDFKLTNITRGDACEPL